MSKRFADLLEEFVDDSGMSYRQLGHDSGVHFNTIINWKRGRVEKPRHWQQLVEVAAALNLSEAKATQLLESTGYPGVADLLRTVQKEEDRQLLQPWREEVQRRLDAPFQVPQLPSAHFVKREKHLTRLREALLIEEHHGPITLVGPPGTGKTMLAIYLAHQLRERFPAGVLWCLLDEEDPMSILTRIAVSYDRDDVYNFPTMASRQQIVRDLLARKRALLVLDAAQDYTQVEPLLPPYGPCAVLITSHNRVLGITTSALHIEIGSFEKGEDGPETDEALQLAKEILGEERAREERASLDELAAELERLPFALDIALSMIASRPGWTTSTFLQELRAVNHRLDVLEESRGRSIRAIFEVAYKNLEHPGLQRFFATLGVFGTTPFSDQAAAYVTENTIKQARRYLARIHDVSLLQARQDTRHRLHMLLGDFAEELVDPAAYQRMVTFFVEYAEKHQADLERLVLEADNIIAAVKAAAKYNMDALLVRAMNASYPLFEARGLYDLAATYLQQAEKSARAAGDTAQLISTLRNLGRTTARGKSDYSQAEAYYKESLMLARSLDRQDEVSHLLILLGGVEIDRGKYSKAQKYLEESLALAEALDNRRTMSRTLMQLGILHEKLGQFDSATKYYRDSLALAREMKDVIMSMRLLGNLGVLAWRQGTFEEAKSRWQETLELARRIDHKERICLARTNLAVAALSQDKYEEAKNHLEEAHQLAERLGHPERLALVLTNLGVVSFQQGHFNDARRSYERALNLAREIGRPENVCDILGKLGVLALKQGQHIQAEEYLDEGLTIAEKLGHPPTIGTLHVHLAELAIETAAHQTAESHLEKSMQLAEELKDPWLREETLIVRGELSLKRQNWSSAKESFQKCLEETEEREHVAKALFGLAKVSAAQNDVTEAQQLGRKSLTILQDLGHYAAEEVRQWLNNLSLPT